MDKGKRAVNEAMQENWGWIHTAHSQTPEEERYGRQKVRNKLF
jgi:hypothetical protein